MMFTRRASLPVLGAAVVGLLTVYSAAVLAQASGPTVFAAASLKNALDEVAASWVATGKPAVRISYAGSNTLAKQIEQGAPADLFLSADLDWMDYAQGKGLIRNGSRVSLLANTIVLVAPKDSTLTVAWDPG